MIKAFIFDMDGTIVNSESIHRKGFNMLLRKYGIYITKKYWHTTLIGRGSRHIAKHYITKYKLPEDIDDFVERRKKKYQGLLRKTTLKPIPGFMEFYKAVKKNGFKVAIASSGSHANVQHSLRAIGLRGIPIEALEQVHFLKPNPEIYNKTAKMLRVKPSECIAFEDSPVGVVAAKKAGMKVVALLTTSSKLQLQKLKPDMIVKDYRELGFEEVLNT